MCILHSRLAHPVGTALGAALLATVLATAAGCGSHGSTSAPGQASPPVTAISSSATSVPSTSLAPSSVTVARSSPASAGTDPSGGIPECKAANLQAALSRGDAATGHVDSAIQFTNIGSTPCLIGGFPGVSYVTDDSGRQVGMAAERDGASGPQVTLAPGQTAAAPLRMTNSGMYEPAACQQTPVRGLRVYPPNDTASLFIAFNFDTSGCAGNVPSPQLTVRTVMGGL